MKILLTSPTFPPKVDGLSNSAFRQAAALSKAGNQVLVCTGVAFGADDTTRKFKVSRFDINSNVFGIYSKLNKEVQRYVSAILEFDPDVILLNAWQNWAADIVIQYRHEFRAKVIVHSHCISTNVFFIDRPLYSLLRYLMYRYYWFSLPRKIRNVNSLIFLADGSDDSRFDDLKLAKRLGIKYRYLSNTYSLEDINTRSVNPRTSRDIFISVGSYDWQKGFSFVIEAYARSSKKNVIQLHLFGNSPTIYLQTLKKQCSECGIHDDYVVFHFATSGTELMKYYNRAILFLYGSVTECQPLVLIDAAVTGTPFVARRTGCISSLDGGISVSDTLIMSKYIETICDNSALWSNLSSDGIRVSASEYSPRLHMEKLSVIVNETFYE